MADFINTVDVIGDEAVIDSIIDRSITEFKDNVITEIGRGAFCGCTDLMTVDIPSATRICANAFEGCASLLDFDMTHITTIDSRAFMNCKGLTEAVLPNYLPYANSTGAIFNGCTSLVKAYLPLATVLPTSIFSSCSSLTELYAPDVQTIQAGAMNSTLLEIVDFPALTTIGNAAFQQMTKLKALVLRSTTLITIGNANVLTKSGVASGTGYVYVPRTLVDSYKAATNWSTYAAQFRALEDYTVDGTITGELDKTKI